MSGPMQHASDFLLDRAQAQELEAEALTALEEHLAQCDACRARQRALAAQRDAFLRHAPSWDAFRTSPRKPRRARGWLWSGGVAAALAASVWLGLLRPPDSTGGVRVKGGPQLGYYVKRGTAVWRGRDPQSIRAGDVLRFTYSTPQPAYLALFGHDGRAATALFPASGQAAHVSAGTEVPLAFGLTLDAAQGDPSIHALFCQQPFDVEPIVRQLAQTNPQPTAADGCSWQVQRLRREP